MRRFGFTARSSASLLARRRAREFSPQAKTRRNKGEGRAAVAASFWLGWHKFFRALLPRCVGSVSPPEDLQARLQGAGRVNFRHRRKPGEIIPQDKLISNNRNCREPQRQQSQTSKSLLHVPFSVSNVDQRCFANDYRIRQKLFMNDCKKLCCYVRPHRTCVNKIFCFIHMFGNTVSGLCPKLTQIIRK